MMKLTRHVLSLQVSELSDCHLHSLLFVFFHRAG